MKKLISILMCAVIMLSLAACSGGKDIDTNVPTDANLTDETTGNTTETTEKKEEEKKISRGTISGDVYTNTFADFVFTKPEDWTYLSDEEISETINAGQDVMDLNAIEKTLTEKASIYDMTAMDAFGNSVMVCYENTMLTAFRKITADEYIEQLKVFLERTTDYDYEYSETEEVTFNDTIFKKVMVNVTVNGVTFTQAYYIRSIDKYIVGIIATATTNEISEIEAMFS